MKLYAGIDLHSNNSVLCVLDEQDREVVRKRLPNDLAAIRTVLEPHRAQLQGVAVESTFNWYWLVDGLMEAGYPVTLVNTTKVKQYDGLKHTNDFTDAAHLAHLMRLGILPQGYIYPKEQRAVRDLLRKRGQLVQERTRTLLSIQNILWRNTGTRFRANAIKQLAWEQVSEYLPDPHQGMAVRVSVSVLACLQQQIELIEAEVRAQCRRDPLFARLKSVPGVGDILAMTIALETGDIHRFARVGQYASYCRCVDSRRESNGKKKGENNRKCGNEYLSWAFVEAANFAIRHYPEVQRFYQRKKARTKGIVAIKATAHKLARASYYVMRDGVEFEMSKAF